MAVEPKDLTVLHQRRRAIRLLSLSGLGLVAALAPLHHARSQPVSTLASLGWYDGDRWRPLALVADKVADFSPSRISQTSVVETGQPDVLRSAVLRDESGRLRALPGGLIVRFRQGTTAQQAREQLAALGLKVSRQIGEDQWLIESPIGLESLRRANELHASGRFANVQPNWWVERRLR